MNNFTLEDIHIGLTQSFEVTVTEAMMRTFLNMTGDINPMHVDAEYAQSKGFEGRVVYGMLTASFLSTLAGVYLPGKHCVLQGVDLIFSKPVYIDDRLSIVGRVSHINEAFRQLEIKATVINQKGTMVSRGKIRAGLLDV
jgi:3-hydroxybutyryl-CoA dehydratase